ncbi:NAD(P)-dependent oxidoreductase [Actinokineospora sp. HUAS TT18]|uniref:NAD(P)-dependent oxidoreductase n=1 Tax=Actinokineospora sp. HUAS TT18 TaxID=3447451 RepID=UPI003F5274A7
MKLTVFAATGRIGHALVEQALAAGHDVTAVVRDPSKLTADVRVVVADLANADPAALEPAVAGADAVLSGLGPRSRADAGITEPGTLAIVTAMRAAAVRRLVVVSAAPVATFPSPGRPNPPRDPGEGFVMRTVLSPLIKAVLRDHYADLAKMEDLLRASDLDWTSIRPPQLNDKPLTRQYRLAIEQNLRGGRLISRADVAHAMLAVLDRPETVRKAVGVAW